FVGFLVDGVEQERWSGFNDWAGFNEPLSAGVHTLKWRYYKDESDSAGRDRVWIDDVRVTGLAAECDDPDPCTRAGFGGPACVYCPLPDEISCDDGSFCTVDDACVVGVCEGIEQACSGAVTEPQCQAARCDEEQDACVADPVREGECCEDGFFCTVEDACAAGACEGVVRDCSRAVAEPQCQAAHCDEEQDACVADPVREGEDCDDGFFCTAHDRCAAGSCVGTGDPCGDGVMCTLDACDDGNETCANTPLDARCDDGLTWTEDFCDPLLDCRFRSLAGEEETEEEAEEETDAEIDFDADADSARMSGPGFSLTANNFRYVHGYASNDGQTDTAVLNGAVGSPDRFRGWANQARMTGGGFYNRAKGFDEVRANATDTTDVAQLYDSLGADTFEAYTDRGTMTYEDGTVVRVDNFRWLHAYASPGAVDTANLYDTTADGLASYTTRFVADVLADGRHRSRMFTPGNGFYVRGLRFEVTHAVSTPGQSDAALLYDSSGADLFEAYSDRATMTYEDGTVVRVDDYRYMHGYSRNGGSDTAILYDETAGGTSYATRFDGYATSARLFTAGYGFYSRAVEFEEIRAALGGGDDHVKLFDDPARVDHLVVPFPGDLDHDPAKATFYNTNRRIYIDDFEWLWATTSQDFVDDKDIDPLYADDVILDGNWTDP
ncbi:MAG: hypothetical protein ABIP48_14570, partial [Planctomycetota bacterium]